MWSRIALGLHENDGYMSDCTITQGIKGNSVVC